MMAQVSGSGTGGVVPPDGPDDPRALILILKFSLLAARLISPTTALYCVLSLAVKSNDPEPTVPLTGTQVLPTLSKTPNKTNARLLLAALKLASYTPFCDTSNE